MSDEIKLGEKYRDQVSGWEGTVTCRYSYMNGCVRYEVSARDKDGKPEAFVFDEQQLVPVDEPPVDVPAPKRTGGDRSSSPVSR
jgi:hypothetical protein